MKKNDIKTLHDKTIAELAAMQKDAEKELFAIRFEHAQNKLKNTSAIFAKRKDIARIASIKRGKELAHENV